MVKRIVLIKLKGPWANDEGRRESAARLARDLPAIVGVRAAEALVPVGGKSGKDWDLCLEVTLADEDAVASYLDDPAHRSLVDDFLRPRLEVIKAWNFKPADLD